MQPAHTQLPSSRLASELKLDAAAYVHPLSKHKTPNELLVAVALLNREGARPRSIGVSWASIGLAPDCVAVVRDLWAKRDIRSNATRAFVACASRASRATTA